MILQFSSLLNYLSANGLEYLLLGIPLLEARSFAQVTIEGDVADMILHIQKYCINYSHNRTIGQGKVHDSAPVQFNHQE
jgi:hypothetical protein